MTVLLLLGALAAPPSPAGLVGRHFYLASEVERIEQHFDPSEWVDQSPSSIDFAAPGVVALDYGQDGERCTFTARGGGNRYDLALACDDRLHDRGRWIWTSDHTAQTDLLTTERGAGVLADVVEPPTPIDLQALWKRFDAQFAAAQLPRLAGRYRDAQGNLLTLTAGGQASFAGRSLPARLLRCDSETDGSHGPCLVLGKAEPGTPAFFFHDGPAGTTAEAGAIGTDLAYHPFEAAQPVHTFTRLR